jgi:hypothetical protein
LLSPNAGIGRVAGVPNKITSDVKEMALIALNRAGGADYLYTQAMENPKSFMAIITRIIHAQITGLNDKDLFPERADPAQIAAMILSILQGASREPVKEPVLIEHVDTKKAD